MNRLKFGILALLFVSLWMSCQKESVELDYDPVILGKWSFTTDDFVSWPEIYDRYMPDVQTAKTGNSSKSIRPALEYEANIVNQITASEQMNEELHTISTEIGLPDWSYLMAFETNSIHEDFELFVPLKNDAEITGVLTFTLSDNSMVIRSTKRNTLDHLVRRDVERSMVLGQTQTVAAFNVFDILTYENETPRYEYWFDEVFSEGFDQVSNAKGYDEFHTYWTYRQPNEGTGVVAREHTWTSRVDCPAPTEVEDPFGGGSIGSSFWDAIDFRDPRNNGTESTISTTTYIDLSPYVSLLEEEAKVDLTKDTITICKQSINPYNNDINTLYISQAKLTSTIGLFLPTTCFHNITIEIPIETHGPRSIEPDFHSIPRLVADALNITLTRERNNLKDLNCEQRSTHLSDELTEQLRKGYYIEYGINNILEPFVFNGIRVQVKNGSNWIYTDLPHNWVTIDFGGESCQN